MVGPRGVYYIRCMSVREKSGRPKLQLHHAPVENERFFVEEAGGMWQVDVYDGILQGIVIAEIELKHESQELILPRWIGKEVTGDSFHRKINMRARALNARRES